MAGGRSERRVAQNTVILGRTNVKRLLGMKVHINNWGTNWRGFMKCLVGMKKEY